MKKWLVKNNEKEISLKSFYNKTKEFADTAILNYNLDNPNYVGLNLIEKDFMQKEDHMTLNKLASMLVEFKNDVDTKFVELNTKINKIDNKVNNLESKVDNLDNKVNNLDNKVNKLDNKVNKLENKVNEGFKKLNNRMDNIENRLSNIEKCPTIQKELSLAK